MTNPISSQIHDLNTSKLAAKNRGFKPWAILAIILFLYAMSVAVLHPTNFFGHMEDDSIYFSSARELALGHGYVMPSLPGSPPATKYPILYPWLLSWVWRINPNFPGNLHLAAILNAGFGACYLVLAFVFLRRMKELSSWAALGLTTLCAASPTFLALTANLMSDVSFGACALAAFILADTIRNDSSWKAALIGGMVAGLVPLLRTVGAPLVLGLLIAVALRAGVRRAAFYAAGCAPFLALLAWRSIAVKPALAPMITEATLCADSWKMTWLYYTSYARYWSSDVLAHHVLGPVLQNGVWGAFSQPGSYFVDGAGMHPAVLAVVALVFTSAVVIRGIARQTQTSGWRPVHLALGLYLLPLLVWDYANFERFLFPFLPLFAAGMWIEVVHLATNVTREVRTKPGISTNIVAGFFCLAGFALLLGAVLSWAQDIKTVYATSSIRGDLLQQKKEAYRWLRENAPQDARIMAYEDASLFLYTSRHAIRPITFSPAGYYKSSVLESELVCLSSSAKPFRATYWLIADDDFSVEWEPANSRARAMQKEMEQLAQPLFRSSRGAVRLYRLDSSWLEESTRANKNGRKEPHPDN